MQQTTVVTASPMQPHAAAPEHSNPPRIHPRTVGWIGTTALAMGGSNQSLFLIAGAAGLIATQGSAAVPLLIIGLILSWMALPGWIELILMWPNRVGGIAATCAEAFRPISPVLSVLTGVCYWWGWIPTCGLTAFLSAKAIHALFLPQVPDKVIAVVIIVLFTLVNLRGITWTVWLAIPIATASALLALISAFAPVVAGTVDWSRAFRYELLTPFDGWFGNLTSAMAGLYLIGFAAPAFEQAACHVGETRDPARNVPRAMVASAVMATIYFLVLPLVWLGVLGAGPLKLELQDVLGPTFVPLLGGLAGAAAIWFMMFNMFHGCLAPLAGAARTLSQLAEDGLLPRIFSLRNRYDTPWFTTVLTAAMAILFLITDDPPWVIAAANLCYLIGICLPSVAVWLLRRDAPTMERIYRASDWGIRLGVIAAIVWGISTLFGFQQYGLPSVIAGIALAYAGSALYAWRRWEDGRMSGEKGSLRSLHVTLTGSMIVVLTLDAAGYFLAVQYVDPTALELRAALEDIFVGVALLTITVGLALPGMITHAAEDLSRAARQLTEGTAKDFSRAMQALAAGDLDGAQARLTALPVVVRTNDELGVMAANFNGLQDEIARAALGLDGAREGLRQARDELTHTNADLQRAKEEAERANLAKSEFLSRTSHELRTPLNSILGFTELMGMDERPVRERENLALILKAGRHLLNLINELLDISQIESGNLQLTRQPTGLSDAVSTAVDLVRALADRRMIRIEQSIPADCYVLADPQRLRQVLLNLISNAVKYNHDGGTIWLSSSLTSHGSVQLAVRDTGRGIPPEKLDRLFTPFDRLGAEQSGIEGTGIGLALVQRLVHAMNGTITVQSSLGEGSTFTLELASASITEFASTPSSEHVRVEPVILYATPVMATSPTLAGHNTLLYIEDTSSNRELVKTVLQRRPGITLLMAEEGGIGIELARQHMPDLILLDLHLPDMSGEQVLEQLRADPALAQIPVIVVSADATAVRIEQAMRAGARDYLTKPLSVRQFLMVLEDLVTPA